VRVCACRGRAARHTSHWGADLRCHLFHGAPDLTPIGAARSWKLVAHRAARGPSPPKTPIDSNSYGPSFRSARRTHDVARKPLGLPLAQQWGRCRQRRENHTTMDPPPLGSARRGVSRPSTPPPATAPRGGGRFFLGLGGHHTVDTTASDCSCCGNQFGRFRRRHGCQVRALAGCVHVLWAGGWC